jgi:anti-sigma regulatory factor (Ser/Thr protein kinase)
MIWFQVSDDGPGLPSRTVPALPEPSRSSGRGLWLAQAVTDALTLTSSRAGTTVTGAIALVRPDHPQ